MSVDIDLAIRSLDSNVQTIAEAIGSMDDVLCGLTVAMGEIARLATHLMDGGAVNVRQHVGLCIGVPLGLNLTPSQCDEIGKFVAEAIHSGALKLTKPLVEDEPCCNADRQEAVR